MAVHAFPTLKMNFASPHQCTVVEPQNAVQHALVFFLPGIDLLGGCLLSAADYRGSIRGFLHFGMHVGPLQVLAIEAAVFVQ